MEKLVFEIQEEGIETNITLSRLIFLTREIDIDLLALPNNGSKVSKIIVTDIPKEKLTLVEKLVSSRVKILLNERIVEEALKELQD